MKCTKTRELLRDYLRQETDPQTTAAVASHLGTCDDCVRELAFLKAYYTKVGSLDTVEAPDNLLVNIKRSLEQTERPRSGSRSNSRILNGKVPRVIWLPQIAGALTVALVVLLVINPFRIGQKIRQDAKSSLEAPLPKTAQTEPKDEAKESATFDTNQLQLKSAPAPVTGNRSGAEGLKIENRFSGVANSAVNSSESISSGERHIAGERRLILTMRQPALMAKKALNAADGAGMKEQNGSGGTDQNTAQEGQTELKKEQRQPAANSSIVQKMKTLVKSVAGEIVQEESEDGGNGLPSLLIRIPVQNYTVFLEKLREIGSLDDNVMEFDSASQKSASPKPSSSEKPSTSTMVAQQFIETRLILKGFF